LKGLVNGLKKQTVDKTNYQKYYTDVYHSFSEMGALFKEVKIAYQEQGLDIYPRDIVQKGVVDTLSCSNQTEGLE
jgi:hypothetical protein